MRFVVDRGRESQPGNGGRKGQNITFYDAAYIQTAEEFGASLLTFDERQMAATEGIAETVHLGKVPL